jgi:UDP-glucuronate 4-epimerase
LKILVTGAAGFIGSQLCERLLADGDHEVIGIDAFLSYSTERWIRERNISKLMNHPRFTFIEQNLMDTDWNTQLNGVDVIYHLAAIPGVRSSWGDDFSIYVTNNILVTQRLLEGCRNRPIRKFIYASTSSVYGEKTGRVNETAHTEPLSPYGVSKRTGEQLCWVYQHNDGVPVVILRFFTVYGPRQRPDMAFHRFISYIMQGKPVPIYGSGQQTRDFTFVSDCVEGTASVLNAEGVIGETINIGGKMRASVLDCIAMLEEIIGKKAAIEFRGQTRGEPMHTWADIAKAQTLLQYSPKVSLLAGLTLEVEDLQMLYNAKP